MNFTRKKKKYSAHHSRREVWRNVITLSKIQSSSEWQGMITSFQRRTQRRGIWERSRLSQRAQLRSELVSPLDQKPPKDPLTEPVQRMVTEHRQKLYGVGDIYSQEKAENKAMDSQWCMAGLSKEDPSLDFCLLFVYSSPAAFCIDFRPES